MSDNFEHYTVAWICALETEFLASWKQLDEVYPVEMEPWINRKLDHNTYKFGRIHEHTVVVACLPKGDLGTDNATKVAIRIAMSFRKIRFALMVGIAGGVPSAKHDIRLGDVVVSSPNKAYGGVIQYDFGTQEQQKEFRITRYLSPVPELLRGALAQLDSQHRDQSHKIQQTISDMLEKNERLRKDYTRPNRDNLCKTSYIHATNGNTCDCRLPSNSDGTASNLVSRPLRAKELDDPVVHYGTIASGNSLMKNAELRDKLSGQHEILCFEMEAAGLMDSFPCAVIRGICDYADTHKNDDWQGYAAATAAAYAKELLMSMSGTRVQHMSRFEQYNSLSEPALYLMATESISGDTIPERNMSEMDDGALFEHLRTLRKLPAMNTAVLEQISVLQGDPDLLIMGIDYWSHMTLAAYDIYERLYNLIIAAAGERNILWFAGCIGRFCPAPSQLIEMWKRFRRDPRQPLPRPYLMALMYMLHVEVWSSSFSNERPTMTDDRRAILRRFCTWCDCPSPPEKCNTSWNFATQNWGLPRLGNSGPPSNCLIYNRYLEREQYKFAPPKTQVPSAYNKKENATMNEVFDAFAKAWYISGTQH